MNVEMTFPMQILRPSCQQLNVQDRSAFLKAMLLLSLLRALSGALTEYDPHTLANLRVLGRHSPDELALYWTGSAIEFDLHGTEVWVELEVDWDGAEPWIAVLERDQLLIRQPLVQGTSWYCLFRGLDAGQSHPIKILRETQAWPDARTSLKLTSIKFDGELQPLPPFSLRIEFVGDSYTSAQGSMGVPADREMTPIWFTATYNYARLAALELNADYRILSQSGWGAVSSYDNNPHRNMPEFYEYVCGVIPYGKGRNGDFNDFEAWVPDIVVVHLGQNDEGGITSGKEWSENGETFLNTPEKFEQGAFDFLVKLRKLNPKSVLAWMFFEGDTIITPALERVVERFQENYDVRVALILVPRWPSTGIQGHPGWETHREYGKTVADKIRSVLDRVNGFRVQYVI
jgi:hypothetical protein